MKRNEDESFADYKARRTAQNKADKELLKGRLVWCSTFVNITGFFTEKAQGTYVRAKHGLLL